jgi:dTDP-4-amino-4,6-dideoxygalactose transaminase
VLARKYFWPGCHRMQPYRSYFPHAGLLLPQTERLAARIIVLPTGTTVGPMAIRQICGIIKQALDEADAVVEALRLRPVVLVPANP